MPSSQRCSLVPNDETKYIGGLQPTILSRTICGNSINTGDYTGNNANTSTRLLKTHRKINKIMDKLHANKVREIEYNKKIKRSRKDFGTNGANEDDEDENTTILDTNTAHVRTKEDEYTLSSNNALIGSKWSLERAIMLNGSYDELLSLSSQQQLGYNQYCKEKDELSQQINLSHKVASKQIYQAYLLTLNAMRQLSLPTHFIIDCMHIACQYAMNRDGFHVKGISTHHKEEDEDPPKESTNRLKEKKLQQKHKNKIQQIASRVQVLFN